MNEALHQGSRVRSSPAASVLLRLGDSPSLTAGLTVFTGRFGSGKTETAINYALMLAEGSLLEVQDQVSATGQPLNLQTERSPGVFLIDLDIVTPYFRSREVAEAMESAGVSVIAPAIEGQYLDLPAIAPAILGTIQQLEWPVVLDVGGDRQGARALGQFSAAIGKRRHLRCMDMHFVVNPFRPFTDTLDGLSASIAEIEASSRLRVTSLVSNPNLMGETTAETIIEGHAEVESFAESLGLPIAFVCVERRWNTESVAYGQVGPLLSHLSLPVLVLDRYFAMPWE
jgi:hypothetical protein